MSPNTEHTINYRETTRRTVEFDDETSAIIRYLAFLGLKEMQKQPFIRD